MKKEVTYLKELEKSLNFDLEYKISLALEDTEKQINAFELYKFSLNKYPDEVSRDSIQLLLRSWLIPWSLDLDNAVFDNLKSIGIDLISNDSLRTQISRFFGYESPFVTDHNKKHWNWNLENIYPILLDNLNFHGTWPEDQIMFLKTDLATINRFETHYIYYMKGFNWRLNDLKPKTESLLKNIRNEIEHLK